MTDLDDYINVSRDAVFAAPDKEVGEVVMSLDLSRYSRHTALARFLELAPGRGLTVTKRKVYQTAAKWYTLARPTGSQSTYITRFSVPPASGI